MKNKFKIVFEDKDLLLLDKASNVLTIPDRFKPELFNLYGWLEKTYGKIFPLHRLDKETSGLLVFAKNEISHKVLSEQFENRTIEKIYSVLVYGKMHEKEGEIDKAIAKHPSKPGKMITAKKGKPSLTLFKTVEFFRNFTLVEANIKTGRTHQIRVHFKSIGYPLAIDALYGQSDAFFLSKIKKRKFKLGKDQEERPLMSRTSLHAKRLVFNHPGTGERAVFESELPKDFSAVLKQLRKWGKE